MTVSSSTNRVSYSGNGTLTTFAYTFKVFDQGDLTVILRSSTGTETVQTITTHYTVTGVGDVGGGNVVFVTAPSATETVVILREQDLTQGLDLVPNDPFPAQSLEESLDKLTFMVQQHEEELGRAIKASRTNTLTGSEFTISAADRANKVFSFDSSGDLSVTQELGTFKGDWAASTAYVERDLVKDTTTNNVFIVTSAHTSSGSLPLTTNTNSDKYEKIIDITNPPGDVTFGGSITTSSSVTAGSFVIGSADINENDLEAIDEVIAGTVAASKAVVVDVNKDISSFRNLTATGDITFGSLSDGTITVTAFVDEDNMASDSATLVPTQQSVKAYVDAQVATADTLTEILGNGNTTSGANIQMTTTDELQFRDTALKINSSADGQLDIDADTEVEITAPTVDINASTEVNISGAAKIGGTLNIDTINELTTNAGTTINSTFIGNNKIGIGTSVVGDTQVAIRGSAAKLRLESLTAGNHNWDVGVFSTSFRIYHQATGQNPFWIDSTDNVGIGTISPSTKLDVNGTVTADGLTVDGDAKFTDISPAIILSESDTTNVNTRLGNYGGDFSITTVNDSDVYVANRLTVDHATGDISFYEDTGTTAKFFWDASAESLGIGTSEINGTLDIANSDQTNGVTLSLTNSFVGSDWTTGDTIGTINFRTDDASTTEPIRGQIKVFDDATVSGTYPFNNAMSFSTGYINTLYERMRIDSSGNVGIGMTSPSQILHIKDTGTNTVVIIEGSTEGGSFVNFADSDDTNVGQIGYDHTSNYMQFRVNDAERMRIDSSGNVLVGTTDTTIYNDAADEYGFMVEPSGQMQLSANNATMLYLNRQNGDGTIIDFRKDGTTVGSIGAEGGDLYIGTTDTALSFVNANDAIVPFHATNVTRRDAFIDFGSPSYRFKDLYLSGGVYLGGTGSSNLLDDYEEGTWTPTLLGVTGITYQDQIGSYTKIGNFVHLSFQLRATWTASGLSYIGGIPFTSRYNFNDYGAGGFFTVQQPESSTVRASMFIQPNSSSITLYEIDGHTQWALPSATQNYLNGNVFYRV